MDIQHIYQETIKFATAKHQEKNQKVPGSDLPYIVHLSNVAMEILVAGFHTEDFDTGFAIEVALLHDTTGKNYTQFKNSLDMVIMFLPVEAAYITALQNDPDLQHYAYRKNVLMVSPANLVVAMKLIFDMWKKDAINKNAEAVADSAGKLYDKLAGFVEDFTKIGRALEGLQSTYNDAHKKLASGKGNIISRAEKMKQLEIKATRSIAGSIATEALLEEDNT